MLYKNFSQIFNLKLIKIKQKHINNYINIQNITSLFIYFNKFIFKER